MKKYSFIVLLAVMATSCSFFNKTTENGKTAPKFGEVIISEVTATGATFSCTLEDRGSYSIQEYGFSYGTEPKPYETGYAVASDNTYSRDFSATVTDLQPQTRYYVTPYVQVGEQEYFVGKNQEVIFTTEVKGDYSSAKVESDNRNVEVHLRGCYRNGNRVKIEATLLNTGINDYANYYLYQCQYGYTIGGYTYNSHAEDDLFTDYNHYAVTYDLNSQSGYSINTQLPLGSTKIFTIAVDGVPSGARTISVYVASEFRNTSPREYVYLTFENVPIY